MFRTLLHSRLKLGIQRYLADDRFQGDIVLLEPREHDADYFATNPLAFWKRARRGASTASSRCARTIEQNFDQLQSVFARYGLRSTARRRAGAPTRARVAQGWRRTSPRRGRAGADAGGPPLRLVGRRSARGGGNGRSR